MGRLIKGVEYYHHFSKKINMKPEYLLESICLLCWGEWQVGDRKWQVGGKRYKPSLCSVSKYSALS